MKTNTRLLFKFLLRECDVDCIFDIGSCDGYESSLFRQLRPNAAVVAFEANPILNKRMRENPNLNNIRIMQVAISDKNGTAQFFVSDLNYDGVVADGHNYTGTSSLLLNETVKVREVVDTPTRRIDDFLQEEYPKARNVALWIDVEGAEYQVLQGMEGIKDRIVGLHVETAREPMRPGQKTCADLEALLKTYGFVLAGDNMRPGDEWGDAVFIRKAVLDNFGFQYRLCMFGGWVSYHCRVHLLGQFLRKHCNPLYQLTSRLYLKIFG
jgi:FkbM family methyltransferase